MNALRYLALACLLPLAGCGSFGGSSLVAGQSRQADVEAAMGAPSDRVKLPNGDTAIYYSRLPYGRRMYVATITPDGMLRAFDQRLTRENFARIAVNSSTGPQVRELLGPPDRVARMPRQQRDVWEYPWLEVEEKRMLWVQFSYDGTVREVIEMHDFESDPPSGPLTGD